MSNTSEPDVPDATVPTTDPPTVSSAGETDLSVMLADLTVTRRPGHYAVVRLEAAAASTATLGDGISALIAEDEGVTAVVTIERAEREVWPFDFVAAWLTLTVHSSLEAVGLTAEVAHRLSAEGIACNVLAAALHDHLLVPAHRADDAIAALTRPNP